MNNNLIKSILERELESKNLIFPFIDGLTNRERLVLEMRSQKKKLEEIGDEFSPKLSRERVRQIEEKAKTKIDFQKKIIETLSLKLGEVLFDEKEIEKVFLDWNKELPIPEAKLKWGGFSKRLWKLKQKNE